MPDSSPTRLRTLACRVADPGWRIPITNWLRQFILALYLAKFSVLMALLLSLVVSVPPQIGELIQLIGERASDDEDLVLNLVRYPGLFLLALGMFSFVCMRSAHLVIEGENQNRDEHAPPETVGLLRVGPCSRTLVVLGCGLAPSVVVAWAIRDLIVGSPPTEDRSELTCLALSSGGMAVGLLLAYFRLPILRSRPLLEKIDRSFCRYGAAGLVVLLAGALDPWLFFFVNPITRFGLGGVTAIFVWGTCIVALGTSLSHLAFRAHLPVLTGLFVLAVIAGLFPGETRHELRHAPQQPSAGNAPLSVEEALAAWRRQFQQTAGQPAIPLFLVAAEGGGIRAAAYTALVLAHLEAMCPGFGRHVFAVSGVSGGSIGAVIFTAQVQANAGLHAPKTECAASYEGAIERDVRAITARAASGEHRLAWRRYKYYLQEQADKLSGKSPYQREDYVTFQARRVLKQDFLSSALVFWLYRETLLSFIPFNRWFVKDDSAAALEEMLEFYWDQEAPHHKGLLKEGFFSRATAKDGWIPRLILNTTEVDTGRHRAISHIRIGHGNNGPLAFRSFEPAPGCRQPRLSSAAFASARFPGITPMATLDGRCVDGSLATGSVRLADGGYFENSGTGPLLAVLDAIVRADPDGWIRPIIIRIENGEALEERQSGPGLLALLAGAFPELMGPIDTLLNTRSARGELHRAQLSAAIALHGRPREGVVQRREGAAPKEVSFSIERNAVPLPLGWTLTRSARAELKRQIGSVHDQRGDCRDRTGRDTSNNNGACLREVMSALRTFSGRE